MAHPRSTSTSRHIAARIARETKSDEERSVVDVDKHRLDEEWEGQPRLVLKHSTLLADARRRVAQLKADRDVVEADLSLKIRKEPGNYGLEKITEASVGAIILLDEGFQKAQRRYHDAEHEESLHFAVVTALQHRKSALECLQQLHSISYFSKPRERNGRS